MYHMQVTCTETYAFKFNMAYGGQFELKGQICSLS